MINKKVYEELYSLMKQIEKDGVQTVDNLVEMLAKMTAIKGEISSVEKLVKQNLLETGFTGTTYVPSVGYKVYLGQTNDKTEYDTARIGREFERQNRLEELYQFVKVEKKSLENTLAEDDEIWSHVNKYTEVTEGVPTVKSSAMTAAEKKEY